MRVLVHENKRRVDRVIIRNERDLVASVREADELRLEVAVRQRPARHRDVIIERFDHVGRAVPAVAGSGRKLDVVERRGAIRRR